MRVFAIADLHLGFGVNRTMDRFGIHWKCHPDRIRSAWTERVAADDLVLVAGDISWAKRTAEAAPDLEWLDALPGTKVIVKGNHDYWWPKTNARLAQVLPRSIRSADRRAIRVGRLGLVGVRGADLEPPWSPAPAPDAEKARARELERLADACGALAGLGLGRDAVRVAVLHYPPFPPHGDGSPFTDLLEGAGISICVFGHLHTDEDFRAVFQGERRGVRYFLTSGDYLDFVPRLLPVEA